MQLFEITLILLALAVVFLQIARRLRVPYPSLLALAGGCVAVLPFAPHLGIQPQLALALFVAPAVAPDGAWRSLAPRLLVAVPGGAVLGVLTAHLSMRAFSRLAGTLSLIIVQFLTTYGTWILAERLQLSPIVAVVALAAVIARY